MKRVLFAGLAGVLIFMVGCKKENPSGITGTWELRQMTGSTVINYPTGNGNILKFTGEKYEAYTNGQLSKSGHYTIITDNTVTAEVCLVFENGQYTQRIIYDNNYNDKKIFLQVSGNNLSLVSGCFAFDGGSLSKYERK